jgi:ferrochelatase
VTQPADYDAVLVVSFGGPEGLADVDPFLDNVFRDIPVRPEARRRVAERYEGVGGVSPINAQTRAFVGALERELRTRGPDLPVYWGNRNWHPMLPDTVARMTKAGVRRALAFVTSSFDSYSGCRKYREDLYDAARSVADAPRIDKLRTPFNHPGFVEATADRARAAFASLPLAVGDRALLIFTAHSLPESMARASQYEVQLAESCRLVAESIGHARWRLAYQSHNASYGREPWLEPDIGDALREARAEGVIAVVVLPIGFVCDHMEVIVDLDVEAMATGRDLGLVMVRAGTVGTHPAYVAAVRELVLERLYPSLPRRVLGPMGAGHDRCPAGCCASGRSGPMRPALCGADDPMLETR